MYSGVVHWLLFLGVRRNVLINPCHEYYWSWQCKSSWLRIFRQACSQYYNLLLLARVFIFNTELFCLSPTKSYFYAGLEIFLRLESEKMAFFLVILAIQQHPSAHSVFRISYGELHGYRVESYQYIQRSIHILLRRHSNNRVRQDSLLDSLSQHHRHFFL